MVVAEPRASDFGDDDRIFHYTSASGLYGILETKCLWATHFRLLNDRKELVSAREALVTHTAERLHPRVAAWKVNGDLEPVDGETTKSASEFEARKFVDRFYETSYEALGESYIFSGFCCNPGHSSYRDGGLLHWATYGCKGGYALQINPHKLLSIIDQEEERIQGCSIALNKVVYSIDELRKKYAPELKVFSDIAVEFVEEMLLKRPRVTDLYGAALPFQKITGALKDGFFSREEEARITVWRLVPRETSLPYYHVEIRHRDGLSFPYIKLFSERLFSPMNPIEAIIIGPHPERELREVALKTYLRSAGLNEIDVRSSNAPYMG